MEIVLLLLVLVLAASTKTFKYIGLLGIPLVMSVLMLMYMRGLSPESRGQVSLREIIDYSQVLPLLFISFFVLLALYWLVGRKVQ